MAGQTIKLGNGYAHIDFADGFGSAIINGRKWCWSFHEHCGPLWLKADGTTERKCQHPTSKAVWAVFEEWLKLYKQVREVTSRSVMVEIDLPPNIKVSGTQERSG